MKLTIKNPDTYISFKDIAIVVIVLFLVCFISTLTTSALDSFSWNNFSQATVHLCKNKDFSCLIMFKSLPLLLLGGLSYCAYLIFKHFFSVAAKKDQIRTINFLPNGVKLKYSQNKKPFLLPYRKTTFLLTVFVYMRHTKYANRPGIVFCEISFLEGGKTFSCRHALEDQLPIITKLLDERNRFNKFELKVMPCPNLPSSTEAVSPIKSRLEDYRKYGLCCRFRKETRSLLLLTACLFFAMYALAAYSFIQCRIYLLLCSFSIFPVVGIYLLGLWYKDNKTAKRLSCYKSSESNPF